MNTNDILCEWDALDPIEQNVALERLAYGFEAERNDKGEVMAIKSRAGWRGLRRYNERIEDAWFLYEHLAQNERFEGWLNMLARRITGLSPETIAKAAYSALREEEERVKRYGAPE